jgi:cell wall assembly regulator SMI1
MKKTSAITRRQILFGAGAVIGTAAAGSWYFNRKKAPAVVMAFRRLMDRRHELYGDRPKSIQGASPDVLTQLKSALPDLPDELFDFYAVYQEDPNEYELLNPYVLYEPATLASHLKSAITMGKDVEDTLALNRLPGSGLAYGTPDDSVRTDSRWQKKWIPIGWFNAEELFVDLNPKPSGRIGQIVGLEPDGGLMTVLGWSMTHFLNRIADALDPNAKEFRLYRVHLPRLVPE